MPRWSCAQTTTPFRASRGVLFIVACLALALRSAASPDLSIPPRAASKLSQGGGHVRLDITSPRSGERVLLRQSADDAQDDALGGTMDDASNSAEPPLGAGGRSAEPSQTIPLALRLSHEPTGTLVTRTVCFVVAALQQGSTFNHTSCTDVVLEEGASDLNADGVGVAVEGEGWYHVRAEAWSVDKDGQRILLTSTSVSFAVTTGSPPATLTPASVLVAIVAPLNTFDVVDETRQHAAEEAEAEANIDTDADAEQGACRAGKVPHTDAPSLHDLALCPTSAGYTPALIGSQSPASQQRPWDLYLSLFTPLLRLRPPHPRGRLSPFDPTSPHGNGVHVMFTS